jgi:hypothetical protein
MAEKEPQIILDVELESVPITVTTEAKKPWWETLPEQFRNRKPSVLYYSDANGVGNLVSDATVAQLYDCAFICLHRAFLMLHEQAGAFIPKRTETSTPPPNQTPVM